MKKLRIRMGEVNVYIYDLPPRSTRRVHLSARSSQQTTSLNLVKCVFPLEAEKGSGLAIASNSKGAPAWQ